MAYLVTYPNIKGADPRTLLEQGFFDLVERASEQDLLKLINKGKDHFKRIRLEDSVQLNQESCRLKLST